MGGHLAGRMNVGGGAEGLCCDRRVLDLRGEMRK